MPAFFVDTSGVVKRYVIENGSTWISGIFSPPGAATVYVSALAAVEVVAAFARKARIGTITNSELTHAIRQFGLDLENQYRVIDIADPVLATGQRLALTYALRGFDALQLAAALEANSTRISLGERALTFVSADINLNSSAAAEGLAVDDPNSHP